MNSIAASLLPVSANRSCASRVALQVLARCLIRCHALDRAKRARGKFARTTRAHHISERRARYELTRNVSACSSIADWRASCTIPNAARSGALSQTWTVRVQLKKWRARGLCEAPHIREIGQGAILVLEPMEPRMMHDSFWRTLSTEDRRMVRNWTWGVLILYGAVALTVFGFASLSRHGSDGSKDPAATAVTAKADRNQVGR